ncbi:hypothetical protein SAMN04488505_111170 [Chitinophaga rupis]|uniref:Uncharacterized protein n=1 Tax=Chitinophaga rupis TaxID=573321 RepID=A0A1H8HW45_9BACT|nr:hypothetical protein [Chitinophaga rupis]SEN60106.1 hypothetical protein SAMN04488505_111170 [Chitinophaga rupis]
MQHSPVKTRVRFAFWVMIALIAFVVLQVFTFCSRTISCPAFSDAAFDAWLPYRQDQRLFFMNSRQQKDSILIEVVERSAAAEIKTGFNGPRCHIYAYVRGKGNLLLNIDNQEAKAVSLALNDFHFFGGAMGDSGIRYVPEAGQYKTVYYNSHLLEGQTFNNVELLEKDTTGVKGGDEHIYRVYLSRENGIIAYERYPSHDLWIKQ